MTAPIDKYASRSAPGPLVRDARPTCPRCRRPIGWCWCARLPRIETRTEVVFLQHPRESDVAIGTARMAHLALPGSRLVEGTRLDDHPIVRAVLEHGDAAVLFPGPEARPLEEWLQAPPRTLVVLDGTWWQAKKLLTLNPGVARLPRLSYSPPAPGNYRIRKEPSDQHLATIEAVAAVVGALEGDPARFASLLQPFDYMVDRQLEAIARAGGGRRRHVRSKPASPPVELLPVLVAPERAVIVYGEANLHGKDGPVPTGAPELLHLVAARPATGERFEALLRPRRPLAAHAGPRLELATEELHAGDDAAAALARFRSFVGDDALWCTWGAYARDLLVHEGEPTRGFIDLRALTARALRRSPGGIDKGAEGLGALVARTPLRGRAGRHLAHLEAVFHELVKRARDVAAPPAPPRE